MHAVQEERQRDDQMIRWGSCALTVDDGDHEEGADHDLQAVEQLAPRVFVEKGIDMRYQQFDQQIDRGG